MDEDKEVIITYETLFELKRIEKEREGLQKLDKDFFKNVVDYIKEKNKMLSKEDIFSFEDKKKTKDQLESIRKTLLELYERREKKIINLALDKSRTGSELIDMSFLLDEEKIMFDEFVKVLDKNRKKVLYNLLSGKLPSEEPAEEKKEDFVSADNLTKAEEKDTKMVRFIHAVPRFVGRELEEYGPFEEEDVANLPNEIAQVLINKGRVEEISED